jgi:hypothetical protein
MSSRSSCWWPLLLISLLLSACGVGIPRRGASLYQGLPPDTVTNTCLRGSVNCPAVMGEPTAAVMRPRVAEMGASIAGAVKAVEYLQRAQVEEALAHCALYAEEKVNGRHFQGRSPTREQCQQEVGRDAKGNVVTRAMELGREKHAAALECLRWRLEGLLPGQFLVEPRYRYNRETKEKSLLSAEEVKRLLESGRGAELVGTIAPDVVIHLGNPLWPVDLFEFKFPCPPSNEPRWMQYPRGHPHAGKNQKKVYEEILEALLRMVTPQKGVQG